MPGRADGGSPLVLSCEHGGNRVPPRWKHLFQGAGDVLESHRGWDPGALPVARALARSLGAPLVATTVTRLLVETNRSLGHPRLFSEFTASLSDADRASLLERYWRPHRERVRAAVEEVLRRSGWVLHLGVHSFTPVLNEIVREVDVGVLYDPARSRERAFCGRWIQELRAALPGLRVRANAPYRGAADGLTTHLRRVLGARYLGVELEVGQALLGQPPRERGQLGRALAATLRAALASSRPAQRTPAPAAEVAGAPRATASPAAAGKRTTPTRGW